MSTSRLNALLAALVVGAFVLAAAPAEAQSGRLRVFVPLAEKPFATPTPTPSPTPEPGCQAIPGVGYQAIPIVGSPSGLAAANHPDINLAVRGWAATSAPRTLIDYNGGTDPAAPQLYGLFANGRTPSFTSTHRVYDWDWGRNTRGNLISTWPVTLLGLGTTVGETLHLPARPGGNDIYQGAYHALVLYATTQRITIKYTREDNIVYGYALHLENVCVDPALLALYQQMEREGRGNLPGLRTGQAFGRARSSEVLVAVRDTGSFMDPRARKDWWAGRTMADVTAPDPTLPEHTTGASRLRPDGAGEPRP